MRSKKHKAKRRAESILISGIRWIEKEIEKLDRKYADDKLYEKRQLKLWQ